MLQRKWRNMQFIATSSKTPALARGKTFQSPQRFGHFLKVAFPSSKKWAKSLSWAPTNPLKRKCSRYDLVHFLVEVIKVKVFLRLNHLYQRLRYNCIRYSMKTNSKFCFKRQKISDVYQFRSFHKLQINRKYCLHPFGAKRVEILYISSHIKEGFYIERENFE